MIFDSILMKNAFVRIFDCILEARQNTSEVPNQVSKTAGLQRHGIFVLRSAHPMTALLTSKEMSILRAVNIRPLFQELTVASP